MIKLTQRFFAIIGVLLSTVPSFAQSWEGEGTEYSPYLIKSAADLQQLAQKVNRGNECENLHFKLINDIDMSSVCNVSLGDWNSIGSIDTYFEGSFDGDGHTISNLYSRSGGVNYKGLFGHIGPQGSISNLKVEGVMYASFWAGMLAGANGGKISNCEVIGGEVEAYKCAGGIVGGNFGIIKNCKNKATIQSTLTTGGICGYNYGGLYGCENTGEIYGYNGAGGLTGYNGGISSGNNCHNVPMGIIQNCSNTAFVSGRKKVGGITGRNDGLVFNNFNNGDLNANEQAGGLVGYNGGFDGVDGYIYNCYNTGEVSASISQAGGVVGVNNSIGDIFNVYNSGKVLVPESGGSLVGTNEGNLNHSYVIGEASDLMAENTGFIKDCGIVSLDSLPQLTADLNQWVNDQHNTPFSHWECLNDSSLPSFSDSQAFFHNVLVYNFHGVIKEDLLAFAEGNEVTLTLIPDSGYILYNVVAMYKQDTIPVMTTNDQIKFQMPGGDVSIYFNWIESTTINPSSQAEKSNLKVSGGRDLLFLWVEEDLDIQIYTIYGQIVRRFHMESGEHKSIKLPAGMYLVNGKEAFIW